MSNQKFHETKNNNDHGHNFRNQIFMEIGKSLVKENIEHNVKEIEFFHSNLELRLFSSDSAKPKEYESIYDYFKEWNKGRIRGTRKFAVDIWCIYSMDHYGKIVHLNTMMNERSSCNIAIKLKRMDTYHERFGAIFVYKKSIVQNPKKELTMIQKYILKETQKGLDENIHWTSLNNLNQEDRMELNFLSLEYKNNPEGE